MEGSAGIGVGFMAVFAVSGSAVLIALQLHKRLLSDFMKKIESEIGGSGNYQAKKKVRFAETVVEPSSNNKEYRLKTHREGRESWRSCINEKDGGHHAPQQAYSVQRDYRV
ncbi:hypothetical protein CK203_104435 [Vitis vinifera]|uniref:Uncharacterized protein n=1 Tax=Vitis vinifera TaxID=29760 RepID=A0A438DHB9_VITVI|nr:hypothetical protein CK203_104435 [Vitis vinifera]